MPPAINLGEDNITLVQLLMLRTLLYICGPGPCFVSAGQISLGIHVSIGISNRAQISVSNLRNQHNLITCQNTDHKLLILIWTWRQWSSIIVNLGLSLIYLWFYWQFLHHQLLISFLVSQIFQQVSSSWEFGNWYLHFKLFVCHTTTTRHMLMDFV